MKIWYYVIGRKGEPSDFYHPQWGWVRWMPKSFSYKEDAEAAIAAAAAAGKIKPEDALILPFAT